jgi:hypothetical protein
MKTIKILCYYEIKSPDGEFGWTPFRNITDQIILVKTMRFDDNNWQQTEKHQSYVLHGGGVRFFSMVWG